MIQYDCRPGYAITGKRTSGRADKVHRNPAIPAEHIELFKKKGLPKIT